MKWWQNGFFGKGSQERLSEKKIFELNLNDHKNIALADGRSSLPSTSSKSTSENEAESSTSVTFLPFLDFLPD